MPWLLGGSAAASQQESHGLAVRQETQRNLLDQ